MPVIFPKAYEWRQKKEISALDASFQHQSLEIKLLCNVWTLFWSQQRTQRHNFLIRGFNYEAKIDLLPKVFSKSIMEDLADISWVLNVPIATLRGAAFLFWDRPSGVVLGDASRWSWISGQYLNQTWQICCWQFHTNTRDRQTGYCVWQDTWVYLHFTQPISRLLQWNRQHVNAALSSSGRYNGDPATWILLGSCKNPALFGQNTQNWEIQLEKPSGTLGVKITSIWLLGACRSFPILGIGERLRELALMRFEYKPPTQFLDWRPLPLNNFLQDILLTMTMTKKLVSLHFIFIPFTEENFSKYIFVPKQIWRHTQIDGTMDTGFPRVASEGCQERVHWDITNVLWLTLCCCSSEDNREASWNSQPFFKKEWDDSITFISASGHSLCTVRHLWHTRPLFKKIGRNMLCKFPTCAPLLCFFACGTQKLDKFFLRIPTR